MPDHTPISENDLNESLLQVASCLNDRKVKYAVIGGMATGYRSQPRFTKDLDVLLAVPQILLPGVLEDLLARGFEFDLMAAIREWTQEGMTVLSYRGIRIDWLKPIIPAYHHILDRATDEPWLGQPIRVATVEGLILLKLLPFRPQDQLDIENLVAAQQSALDLDWIKAEWQTAAPLDDPRMVKFLEWVAK